MKIRVLALCGATGSGKSALSMALAKRVPAEIVCMDSMQIYRHMDIGTAKPTKEERAAVPHHMLDVAEPWEEYSVALYKKDASEAIRAAAERNRLPILTGGTGMYLRALSLPMTYGETPGHPKVRAKYEKIARDKGNAALHAMLEKVDAKTAGRLHENDVRRVVRALEVYEVTGRPMSEQVMPSYEDGPFDILPFHISWERRTLYERIDRRVGDMLKSGLLDEVRRLVKMGVTADMQSMQGIGYKEMLPCVLEGAEVEAAADSVRQRTRNYAKRQLTWFRADERIRALDGTAGIDRMADTVLRAMEEEWT